MPRSVTVPITIPASDSGPIPFRLVLPFASYCAFLSPGSSHLLCNTQPRAQCRNPSLHPPRKGYSLQGAPETPLADGSVRLTHAISFDLATPPGYYNLSLLQLYDKVCIAPKVLHGFHFTCLLCLVCCLFTCLFLSCALPCLLIVRCLCPVCPLLASCCWFHTVACLPLLAFNGAAATCHTTLKHIVCAKFWVG